MDKNNSVDEQPLAVRLCEFTKQSRK